MTINPHKITRMRKKVMKKDNIIISYGYNLYDIKQKGTTTHSIRSIYIDNRVSNLSIIVDHDLEVSIINISMEEAEEMGFINFQALIPYCSKMIKTK